jgi:hypothetical protein
LRLDVRPLAERLARATAKARGIGDVIDDPVVGLGRDG